MYFFLDGNISEFEVGKTIFLSPSESRHIIKSLRHREGDVIKISNGNGVVCRCLIESFDQMIVEVRINDVKTNLSNNRSSPKIDIALSLLPSKEFDLAIEKMTEFGINYIFPYTSSRTIVQLNDKKIQSKLSHWNDVILSASKQCERPFFPTISKPKSLDELAEIFSNYDMVFIGHTCQKSTKNFKDVLVKKKSKRTLTIIGPEGGFSEDELSILRGAGASVVNFGSLILKSNTAPLFAASIIQYLHS